MDNLASSIIIAGSGMRSQGVRLKTIAQNIANASSTGSDPTIDPYRRKVITFKNKFDKNIGALKPGVDKIIEDQSNFKIKYQPNHPAADQDGYVKFPNVNSLIETMDLREAQNSYQANLNVILGARRMFDRAVQLLN